MSIQKSKILVGDVMLPIGRFPVIKENTLFKEALEVMSSHKIGIACILNEKNSLLGIVTDGDVRRMLLKVQKPFSAFFADDAIEHAVLNPHCVRANHTLLSAVNLMEQEKIWDLPVVDESGRLLGLLHLHPAVNALFNSVD